ncbi:hypothetical protein [Lysobacter rhizosphaerae]
MSTREGPAPRQGIQAVLPVFLPVLLLCTSACAGFPAMLRPDTHADADRDPAP